MQAVGVTRSRVGLLAAISLLAVVFTVALTFVKSAQLCRNPFFSGLAKETYSVTQLHTRADT